MGRKKVTTKGYYHLFLELGLYGQKENMSVNVKSNAAISSLCTVLLQEGKNA